MSRLVVVSNRIALPDDKKSSAGGLAVGILGALRAAGGLWVGWGGGVGGGPQPPQPGSPGDIFWAAVNLNERGPGGYYNPVSNALLWAGFPPRPVLVRFLRGGWGGY
ncbi:alpha,alpha-trehalose-phosphate synthase, partial [Klebsiella pneumoniae]|nr:alpha,alpha-trehalose-phosphate synthase [Klebsiella pneumoniae]